MQRLFYSSSIILLTSCLLIGLANAASFDVITQHKGTISNNTPSTILITYHQIVSSEGSSYSFPKESISINQNDTQTVEWPNDIKLTTNDKQVKFLPMKRIPLTFDVKAGSLTKEGCSLKPQTNMTIFVDSNGNLKCKTN